jgi:hypothetical protein
VSDGVCPDGQDRQASKKGWTGQSGRQRDPLAVIGAARHTHLLPGVADIPALLSLSGG